MFNINSIEDWERLGDMLEELADWEAYEADMATNPYDDPWLE